jgi:hypothetical protein
LWSSEAVLSILTAGKSRWRILSEIWAFGYPAFLKEKKTKKKNFREAKKIFPWDFWDFKFWSGTNVNISLCEA